MDCCSHNCMCELVGKMGFALLNQYRSYASIFIVLLALASLVFSILIIVEGAIFLTSSGVSSTTGDG